LDALPQAGNTASISLMADILKVIIKKKLIENDFSICCTNLTFTLQENKLSARQALGWYLSMPLAKFVDLDSIKAILVSSVNIKCTNL
jgi:hypothetical protein